LFHNSTIAAARVPRDGADERRLGGEAKGADVISGLGDFATVWGGEGAPRTANPVGSLHLPTLPQLTFAGARQRARTTRRSHSAAMELGLEGTAILITGAAGGIGSATARALAAEGARVGVHYHSSQTAAERLAAEIGGVALQADLTQEAAADALVPDAVEALGRLDGCVANAGTWDPEDVPIARMPMERWRKTIEDNLTATFLTARAYMRHVEAAGTGSLVLVGSTSGIFGEAGHADYSAAKGAMTAGLLPTLKNEMVHVAPAGRVNLVAPGWTVTPMTEHELTQETVERVTATMALRKVATAGDVARAIVFLLSPLAAGHVTGEVITVAGGMEGRLLHPPGAPSR
jgi:3-oxoacyl-[acyl-carrier protein] reductase